MNHAVPPKARSTRRLRGSRACDCCHTRKVRCDIDLTGPGKPCTNCRLDGQDCVSYRGSKARAAAAQSVTKSADAAKQRQIPVESQLLSFKDLPHVVNLDQRPLEKRLIPRRITHDQTSHIEGLASLDLQIAELWAPASGTVTPVVRDSDLGTKPLPDFLDFPKLRFGDNGTSRGLDDHVPFSYYEFLNLKSLSKAPPDDVRYLEFTGSLHIPTRPVLNELVKEYFLHVHPILPVVDERAFWAMYDHSTVLTDTPCRLSLFVFQSMLFAACAMVPLEILRCCGFVSLRQARETFYRRAKTIYDVCKEPDCYAVAQGALLLSYYTTNADPNMNSTWLSIATQNARLISAQLYHVDQSLSRAESLRKKRLWWCCILRDRILPLGVRRAVQITHHHFDFSQRFSEADLEDEVGFSRVYDAETQRQLFKVCAAQCDLAATLTSVLITCYPVDGSFSLFHQSSPDVEASKISIQQHRLNLDDWLTNLNEQISQRSDCTRSHVSVSLYTSILQIYYHSARLALAQYEILVFESHGKSVQVEHAQNLDFAKSELQSATSATTEIVEGLIKLNVAQYLPISAVAYTALPLVLTALNLKMSSDAAQASARRRQLEVYVHIMKSYRKRYDGTDQVSAVVERLLNDADPITRRICSSSGTITPERSLILSAKSRDWSDILRQRPKFYVRLTLALDMAFSHGRFPDESDLPTSCRISEVQAVGDGEMEAVQDHRASSLDHSDITLPCMQASNVSTPRINFRELHHHQQQQQAMGMHVNLDFADLFDGVKAKEHEEYGNPWMDDLSNVFDFNTPI